MALGEHYITQGPDREFPGGGYPDLSLLEVYETQGPVTGWAELHRRTSEPTPHEWVAEVGIDMMRRLGQVATPEDSPTLPA